MEGHARADELREFIANIEKSLSCLTAIDRARMKLRLTILKAQLESHESTLGPPKPAKASPRKLSAR